MMKKGFTLIELAVAIGLLVIIMTVSAVIFRTGSEAMRMASANAEIMHKFQTIVSHLEADFRGFDAHREADLLIPVNMGSDRDSIAFLAYGIFDEIIDSYEEEEGEDEPKLIQKMPHSNAAIVYYGLTNDGKLLRRQTLLTFDDDEDADTIFDPAMSRLYKMSTSELRRQGQLGFDVREWLQESDPNPAPDPDYLRQVIADNVSSFNIEGIFLGRGLDWDDQGSEVNPIMALKFTFRIADSRDTQESLFSHIIYLVK